VYNCAEYIDFAIRSIINQTYSNWELLIIDDNSTDGTIRIIEEIKNSRIIIIKNRLNKGLPYCLNQCIKLSKGEYFARMDGDDIMTTDRLEKQISFLEKHPDIDLLGGLAYTINDTNEIIGFKYPKMPQNINELISLQNYFIHPTVVGKLNWFNHNLYDEKIHRCQDFELWLRTYEHSRFFVLNEFVLFYRQNDGLYKQKYYQVYKNLTIILKKHRTKMSYWKYSTRIIMSYLKYIFFKPLNRMGLLNRNNRIDIENVNSIQKHLNKAIF